MPIKLKRRSFRMAFQGIADAARTQPHMQFHLATGATALLACFLLSAATWEWMMVILCITIVLALEILNTAVEYLVDLVSPEWHPLAKKAKDAAAGAVLVSAVGVALVGLCLFLPKIIRLIPHLL
jgi:diacylglycerol kinase